MKILGIHYGHDATVAVIDENLNILSAISKERVSRKKNDTGFFDVRVVLDNANVKPEEIDYVTYGSYCNSNRYYDALTKFAHFEKNQNISFALRQKLSYLMFSFEPDSFLMPNRILAHKAIEENLTYHLKEVGINAPLVFIDHHLSHAASAHYTSGWEDSLVVTADGRGDLQSIAVYVPENGRLKKVHSVSDRLVSLGDFYSSITTHLGFKANKHEGKITGLASYGKPSEFTPVVDKMIRYDENNKTITSDLDKHLTKFNAVKSFFNGGAMGKHQIFLQQTVPPKERLDRKQMQLLAHAFQKRLEDVLVPFVNHYALKYKKRNICLAGSIFANVKLNQRIIGLPSVDNVYIHPAMGDTGLALGAALEVLASKKPIKPKFIKNVYLGMSYTDEQMKAALDKAGIKAIRYDNVAKEIAKRVAAGKVVDRFNGKMEYGLRALGNRTIIGDPRDKTINDVLNERLKRTEFMPFAPSIMEEHAHEWFKGWDKDHIAAHS